MKRFLVIFCCAISTISFQGCGSAVDPLELFRLQSGTPILNGIIPNPAGLPGQLVAGFASTRPYWTFSNLTSGFGGNYLSPANGWVLEVGTSALSGGGSTNFIRIAHTGRLQSILYGLQSINVRPGDVVLSQQTIGTFFTSATYTIFQVMLDNIPVCPLSYLSDSFRASLGATNWAVVPCL